MGLWADLVWMENNKEQQSERRKNGWMKDRKTGARRKERRTRTRRRMGATVSEQGYKRRQVEFWA